MQDPVRLLGKIVKTIVNVVANTPFVNVLKRLFRDARVPLEAQGYVQERREFAIFEN